MKKLVLSLGLLLCFSVLFAQKDSTETVGVRKKGWSFGALPAISYNSDLGFQYGALANIYNYGDGSRYPDYDHSIYVEWSRTTKGSGINQLVYDSERLIPKTRLTAELSYFTEQALDFYGFNGYGSYFNNDYGDTDSDDYLSRMFYRIDRRAFLFKSDFQVNLMGEKLRALIGYSFINIKMAEVDIDKLNEGKDEADKLPSHDDVPGLYRYYVDAGIIPDDEKAGGANSLFKIGAVWDTRDFEANPSKGIWAEAFVLANPGFSGSGYGKLIVNWRQYFTLVQNRINFAYRLSYQPKIWGDIPWYMRTYIYNSKKDRNGLGGSKSLRGILRNRVVGDGVAFANFELRTIPFRTVIWNQNFYVGIVPFVDMGLVTHEIDVDYSLLPTGEGIPLIQPTADEEGLHLSYGAELKLVLNENFIVSVSYGMAADERDGGSGLYIGLNYLF